MRLVFVLSIFIIRAVTRGDAAEAETKPSRSPNASGQTLGSSPALRDELAAMVKPDQATRQKRPSEMTKSDFDLMLKTDAAHEQRMREIIAQFGWPGRSLVGAEGSVNAWLLVQHCGLPFQEQCLPLLEQAVAKGDASAANYAYLLDRVRMFEGKPQVYGTQFMNGKLYTLEDPTHVDERRKSVGLGPEAEYEKKLRDLQ